MTEIGVNVGGAAKREIGFRAGPLFSIQDDVVMFQIGLDASSIIGPRLMKARDRDEYMEAWFRFCDENPDYDVASGERRAQTRVVPQTAVPPAVEPSEAEERAAIKAELTELGAGQPHPRSGLPKLREALAEARAAA